MRTFPCESSFPEGCIRLIRSWRQTGNAEAAPRGARREKAALRDKTGTLGTTEAAGKRGPAGRWTDSTKGATGCVHRAEQRREDGTLWASLTHSIPRRRSP